MAAKKRAAGKRARVKEGSKRRLTKNGTQVQITRAQKRSVKDSLGAIKNDVEDIELRIDRVVDTLDSVDFIDD